MSTRAPYAPVVVLFGAILVLGVVIRLLNSPATEHPLSGAPVGDGNGPVVVTDPANKVATGSLSLMLPVDAAGEVVAVGPAAFPPGARVSLSVLLTTDQPTSVEVALAQLQPDGTLAEATPVSIDVTPDANGSARVIANVDTLTTELGPGIYRVDLLWQGERIGGTDVALGQNQPSNVAIFDEARAVTFAAGTYTGIQVDANGQVTGQKPYELTKDSGAPAAAFGMVDGSPHLLISAGIWAGYWVPVSEGMSLQ